MRGQGLSLVSLLLPVVFAAPSPRHNLGLRHEALISSYLSTGLIVVSSTITSTVYVCPTNGSSSAAWSSSEDITSTVQPVDETTAAPSSNAPVIIVAPYMPVPTTSSKLVVIAPPLPAPMTSSKIEVVAPPLPALTTSSKPNIVAPPPLTTTASSLSPIETASRAGFSGKIQKGVIYEGDDILLDILNKSTEVEFIINWSPVRPKVSQDIEFMPQLWQPPATGDVSLATFQGGTAKAAAMGSKWLLAWGEQAKKDSTLMAEEFMSILQPEAEKLGLMIAAPSVLQNPMRHNKPWLTDFLNTCDALGCKISALTAHYWAPTGDPDWFKDFQNYVNTISEIRPNLPVFIDNLSMNGTTAEQLVFLQKVMTWAVAHDNIARVGFIPAASGSAKAAYDANGNLNELGRYWFGA